jgi:hypothetical protein
VKQIETPLSSTAIAVAKTPFIFTASAIQQIPSSTLSRTKSLTSTLLASASSPTTLVILNSDTNPTKASSFNPSSSGGNNGTGSAGSGLNTASLIGTIIASVTGAVSSFIGAWFAWKNYKIWGRVPGIMGLQVLCLEVALTGKVLEYVTCRNRFSGRRSGVIIDR